jgi:hypothetical protein
LLKEFGVTAQREIEKAVRQAVAEHRLKGSERLPAKLTLRPPLSTAGGALSAFWSESGPPEGDAVDPHSAAPGPRPPAEVSGTLCQRCLVNATVVRLDVHANGAFEARSACRANQFDPQPVLRIGRRSGWCGQAPNHCALRFRSAYSAAVPKPTSYNSALFIVVTCLLGSRLAPSKEAYYAP